MSRQLVFDHAANPFADDPLYKLSSARAQEMIASGEAFRVRHPITGLEDPRRIQKYRKPCSEEELLEFGGSSETSLTESDNQNNAGALDANLPETDRLVPVYAIRNGRPRRVGMEQPAIAQARNRVNFWPFEYDRNAVYVPPVPPRSSAQRSGSRRITAPGAIAGGLLAVPAGVE